MQYTSVTYREVTLPGSYMAVGVAFTGGVFSWKARRKRELLKYIGYAMNTWARGIWLDEGDVTWTMALAILAPPREEGSIGFA